MKRTVVLFVLFSAVSKLIAFSREIVLSYLYGATEVSDIFLLSMTLPITIFGFIATGVTSGFIPIYQRVREEKDFNKTIEFTNSILNMLFALCCAIIVIYFVFSENIISVFASGFSGKTKEIAIKYTDIGIWALPFTAMTTVFVSYLQINDRIKITALSSVPLNLGIILTICIAAGTHDNILLPYGFLASSALQAFFLLRLSIGAGYKYNFSLGIKDTYVRLFFSGLTLLVISSSIQQINILVDRTLATGVVEGGLSLFEYGSRVNDFIMGISIIPVSASIFPLLTKKKKDTKEFSHIVEDGIKLFSITMIPITSIVVMYSEEIVRLIYYRGEFGENAVVYTTQIVLFYGVGLIAFATRELITKVFYVRGDIKTPVVNSAIGIVINIALNFVLLRYIGLGGLALATSVSAFITVALLWRKISLSDIEINQKKIGRGLVLSVVCTICGMGVSYPLFCLFQRAPIALIIRFTIALFVFLMVYIGLSFKFSVIDAKRLGYLLRNRERI